MKRLLFLLIQAMLTWQESPAQESAFYSDSVAFKTHGLKAPLLVENFYASRDNAPAWTHFDRLSNAAEDWIEVLARAGSFGLAPQNYHFDEIHRLKALNRDLHQNWQLEFLLTDSFLAFAHHLKYGQLEKQKWVPQPVLQNPDPDLLMVLEKALEKHSFVQELEQLEPRSSAYHHLKTALQEKLLQFQQLDLSPSDQPLLAEEIKKLALNMERWRWESAVFPDRHILINVPSYHLQVIENGTIALESKVIVGTNRTQTPNITSEIKRFVVYPYWHVPRSIATGELLPKIQRDPSYLAKNDYEVLQQGRVIDASQINWKEYNRNNFPFTLRQGEGLHNALGIIKFEFQSPYAIFLHDTNAKQLFGREIRSLSHGCIRIEKATELAQYLIRGHRSITSEMLTEFLKAKKQRDISIPNPIPIFVRYFTADERGVYPDVYGKDKTLINYFDGIFYQRIIPLPLNLSNNLSF